MPVVKELSARDALPHTFDMDVFKSRINSAKTYLQWIMNLRMPLTVVMLLLIPMTGGIYHKPVTTMDNMLVRDRLRRAYESN